MTPKRPPAPPPALDGTAQSGTPPLSTGRQLAAGAIAAVAAWGVGYPFDIIKTRCQMSATSEGFIAAAQQARERSRPKPAHRSAEAARASAGVARGRPRRDVPRLRPQDVPLRPDERNRIPGLRAHLLLAAPNAWRQQLALQERAARTPGGSCRAAGAHARGSGRSHRAVGARRSWWSAGVRGSWICDSGPVAPEWSLGEGKLRREQLRHRSRGMMRAKDV